MQMWTKIGSHHLNNLLRNRRFPKRPDMTINVPGLKSPVNIDDNYGLRLTAYYKVGLCLVTMIQVQSHHYIYMVIGSNFHPDCIPLAYNYSLC